MQPGNGTSETSNSIAFGQSVTGVSVSPSSRVAGASSNYVVSFRASDAIPAGGEIVLSEPAGQTNFATVTGIEVTDSTRSWHMVATGATLASGSARIPLSQAVNSWRRLDGLPRRCHQPPGGHGERFRRIDLL